MKTATRTQRAVGAESDQTVLLPDMTGGSVQDSEIAVLRVRSELLFLEDPDDQLHPVPRPRTAMGLHSASIRITEFGKERANPQPRSQQGEGSRGRGVGEGNVPNQYLSPSRLVSIRCMQCLGPILLLLLNFLLLISLFSLPQRAITGSDDLSQVYHLNLTINCTFTSLGNFGESIYSYAC